VKVVAVIVNRPWPTPVINYGAPIPFSFKFLFGLRYKADTPSYNSTNIPLVPLIRPPLVVSGLSKS